MDLITDRLPSTRFTDYHSSYRTVAMGLGNGQGLRVFFDDGTVASQSQLLGSRNLYFIWLLSHFQHFADSLKKPWMIVNGDTVMFDKLEFTGEEMRTLRRKGVNIFLYEPLFFLNDDKTWPWVGDRAPFISDLEEISNFYRKWNIPVEVFLCEYGMGDYLRKKNYYSHLKFHDFSTLLMHEIQLNSIQSWPLRSFDEIQAKIISLNFRYEPTREMLVAFLRSRNRVAGGFVSFFHCHDKPTFLKRLPFDPTRSELWPEIQKGIETMQAELPYKVDTKDNKVMAPVAGTIPDMSGHNQRNFWWCKEFMSQAFAFAYCESRPFSPVSEISEKTIHPILSMRPFVVFASPGYLKGLRGLGFKTFDGFWDESYDEIEDHQKRFTAFLKTVDFIASQELSTLKDWGRNILPVVEHNRLHMMRNFVPGEIKRLQNQFSKWYHL